MRGSFSLRAGGPAGTIRNGPQGLVSLQVSHPGFPSCALQRQRRGPMRVLARSPHDASCRTGSRLRSSWAPRVHGGMNVIEVAFRGSRERTW